ncbi:MAG: flagellar basal body rod protein FlgB [Eubacteriales bacterium]
MVFLIDRLLFNKTMSVLEQGLNAASLRNTVIANNLANVETPGYKRSDVVFEEELRKALSQNNSFTGFRTNEKHIPIGSPSVINVSPQTVIEKDTTMRNDGNNVDIDREMAALAKNEIMYQAIAQELNEEFQKLKSAIAGR